MNQNQCRVCSKESLVELEIFQGLSQVTSDCKPWRHGGRIALCKGCSTVQKIPDSNFLKSITEIYSHYDMFHQSGGIEQSVYSSTTGAFEKRSISICKYIESSLNLADSGKILDVGCANGGTLRAYNTIKNKWDLYGHDLGLQYIDQLKTIPGFKSLYCGDFSNIEGEYNLITIVHALEHFLEPVDALNKLSRYIHDDGYLFIEVPNAQVNPFDLIIADHVCHFTTTSLQCLISSSGYELLTITDCFIDKELTIIARPQSSLDQFLDHGQSYEKNYSDLVQSLNWLGQVVTDAKHISRKSQKFGIFGTSISGTWLASMIDDLDFFVDEDPSRIGQSHMGKPIFSPAQIPNGSSVYMPLIPKIAERISRRISSNYYDVYLPPKLSTLKLCA